LHGSPIPFDDEMGLFENYEEAPNVHQIVYQCQFNMVRSANLGSFELHWALDIFFGV
jgi:hypothetical protein